MFNSGSVKSITGNFSGNEVSGNSVYGIKGGAVYNYQGTIGNIKGSFDNNRILAEYAAYGSAVFNDWDSKIGDITGNFSGNSVQFGSGSVYGGAVYNDNGAVIGDIRGDFVSNRVFPKATAGRKLRAGPFSTITIHPSAAFSAALSTTALKPLPLTVWLWAVPFIPIRT